MPVLIIDINVTADAEATVAAMKDLSTAICELFNKPLARVPVQIKTVPYLMFAGDEKAPAAVASLSAIGVSDEQKVAFSKVFADVIKKYFNIPLDRYLLVYQDLSPSNVGSRGSTIGALQKQAAAEQQQQQQQ